MILRRAVSSRVAFGVACVGIVGIIGVLVSFPSFSFGDSLDKEIATCTERSDDAGDEVFADTAVDCWYALMQDALAQEGIAAAFDVFERLYDTVPLFVETGCHRHAHRLGDMAYFQRYVAVQDIERMSFPPETTYCGFGFYHGFIEHLIADRPDPVFAQVTCEYLDKRLGGEFPDIRATCFHGSGHGFMLAPVDTALWGNASRLVRVPITQCGEMSGTTFELKECRKGIFNVIVEWMFDGEYGLAYNEADPFGLCREQPDVYQEDCYYEMAQKLDSITSWNTEAVAELASHIGNPEHARTVISVAIAGMMQRALAYGDEVSTLLDCQHIPDFLVDACIRGAAGGIIENGPPGREASLGLRICASDGLSDTSRRACYETVIDHLSRTRSAARLWAICEEIPDKYTNVCND